ncbi:MAG: hypothetical protein L0323_15305 [Planctomycetes bacterium]|nr:hypothetical protein [Planctomycetota bacterium]
MRSHGANPLPLVLLLLALIGVVAAGLLFSSGGETPGGSLSPATTAPPPETSPPDEPTVPEAPVRAAPPPERLALPTAPETKPAEPAAEFPPATLEARIVDASAVPLPGARLRWGKTEAFSGAGGLVALSFPSSTGRDRWTARCEASLPGYATRLLDAEVEAGRTTRLGDVVLHPGGKVAGRVLDPSKRGIPGITAWAAAAELSEFDAKWVRFHGPGGDRTPSAKSGEDGAFLLEGLAPGFVRIWANGEGTPYAFSPPVEVRAGVETAEVVLVLEPFEREDLLEGIVLSPDGAPVPSAPLVVTYRTQNTSGTTTTNADERGRFRFVLHPRAPRDLRARDPQGRWSDAVAKGVAPGTLGLELRLAEPKWLEVRVLDEGGAPVEEFAAHTPPSGNPHSVGDGRNEPHPGGTVRLRIPPDTFLLCVSAPHFAESDQGPFDPGTAPSSIEVRLRPLPGVSGLVLAEGKPQPRARVALHEVPSPGTRIEHNGFPTRVQPTAEASGETDGGGRFRLTLRKDARFVLRAEASAFAPAETGPFDLRAAVGRQGIEVVLNPGGAIEGRVIPAAGRDANGVVVAVNRGDGHPSLQRVGVDGRYRFERLTPGRWNVEERENLLDPGHSSTSISSGSDVKEVEFPWVCEVVEGQTTYYDLDLSGAGGRVLLGELLIDGAPAGGWTAVIRPEKGGFPIAGRDRQTTATDREGRFTIPFPPGDRFRLALESDAGSGVPIRLSDLVSAQPRDNRWRLDLPTGRLEGERAPTSSGEGGPLTLLWSGPGELRASVRFTPDPEGRVSLPLVPAGRVRLARPGPGGPDSDPSTWPTLLEVDVAPGRVARIALP